MLDLAPLKRHHVFKFSNLTYRKLFMIKFFKAIFILIASLCVSYALAKNTVLFYEAETFQFQADWSYEDFENKEVLQGNRSKFAPATVVEIPQEAVYSVWVRAYDNLELLPKSRRFDIEINGEKLPIPAGTHGVKTGLEWQKLGEISIPKGDAYIKAKGVPATGLRFDAIILTDDASFNPVGKLATNSERSRFVRKPKLATCVFDNEFTSQEKLSDIKNPKTFSIQNQLIKITFTEKKNSAGKSVFVRSAEFVKRGKAYPMPSLESEVLFLTYSAEIKEEAKDQTALWTTCVNMPKVKIGDKLLDLETPAFDPYSAGENKILRPIAIKILNEESLALTYESGVSATLTLQKNSTSAKFDVQCKIDKYGFYSFGMLGFFPCDREDMNATLLPPMYQMRRTMPMPKLMGNAMTSQPLSLIESGFADTKFAYGFVANPKNLPWGEWSKFGNSIYGFSLASPKNQVQPAIFQPVLGGRNSEKNTGDILEASWYIVAVKGDWKDALELANQEIFDGAKLREPYTTSLSETLCNIAKYMKNEDASGWSKHLKGRWNVEFQYAATQSSPLAELEVALLTDDAEYYKNISLPAVEYTLSRRGFHFSSKPGEGRSSVGITYLTVPNQSFWGDYYASINAMLGSGNTWAKKFYDLKLTNFKFSAAPQWAVDFGLYLADPSEDRLNKAVKGADDWISKAFKNTSTNEVDFKSFVNVSFYPYWWYLIDLYEITNNKKYLDFALEGSFYTLSSLWSYPTPPSGEVTVHPDGIVEGTGKNWWKGDVAFRLGHAETREAVEKYAEGKNIHRVLKHCLYAVKEHKAEAMSVSRLGLGIEQPITYMIPFANFKNIIMPSWAPEMLKVYQYTKNDIIFKYSRHSIIGRYANFPGYYVKDFTDVQLDPEYPYKGPDVTGFYYHHAPCHFAHITDYLMAQLEQRSENKIKFPFVRQQGYVWFTDRIFGKAGKVFEDENVKPLLAMDAVKTNTPLVSIVCGRASDGLWLMLLNDSAQAVSTALTFDASQKLLADVNLDAPAALYNSKGVKTKDISAKDKINIPALSLVAVKIPAKKIDTKNNIQALPENSHIVKENLGSKSISAVHAFRIRSTFGDSIYALALCDWKTKAKISLHLEGDSKKYSVEKYPYEITVFPIDINKDAKFYLTIEEEGKEAIKTETFILTCK